MDLEVRNKKILVSGGAGFIGSNICEKLIELGNNVVCLDNLSTGNKANIKHLLSNKNFIFFEGDIRNLEHCINAAKNTDYVLHQAALGSVPRSIKDPVSTNDVNVGGFLNMLIASRDNKVKRFIYAASSSTYGDSTALPKVEENIGKPLSPYAVTKYVNELYAEIFSRIYGLETIGLRYFNVYGRRQDPNGAYAAVIPKFVSRLMKYESPIINGDGSFSRDFTYVDDVIQANLLAILTNNKNAINNVYNIAYGNRNSLNNLVAFLQNSLLRYDSKISKIKVIYGPERDVDIPHSHASIIKAKKLLNYKPKYTLSKGIDIATEWYWNNL